MTYIKSYIRAFIEIMKVLGLIYLVAQFLYGAETSMLFVYISVAVAFGGPISLLISGKEDAK